MSPQLAINPFYQAAAIDVRVKLHEDDPGATISARIENQMGKVIARHQVGWRTERDLTRLGLVFRDLVDHFSYGIPDRLDLALKVAVETHLPRVPRLGPHPLT